MEITHISMSQCLDLKQSLSEFGSELKSLVYMVISVLVVNLRKIVYYNLSNTHHVKKLNHTLKEMSNHGSIRPQDGSRPTSSIISIPLEVFPSLVKEESCSQVPECYIRSGNGDRNEEDSIYIR